MTRQFHAKIQVHSWLLLAAMLFVAVYAGWTRNGLILALALLMLVLLIERMIRTTYTVSDTELTIHTSRFARDRVIPLSSILRVERISSIRLFGRSFSSFLLITYGDNQEVAVIPTNEADFIKKIKYNG